MHYETILNYLAIPATYNIKNAVDLILLVIVLILVVMTHNAWRLCTYFGYEVMAALWSPFVYIKTIIKKKEK